MRHNPQFFGTAYRAFGASLVLVVCIGSWDAKAEVAFESIELSVPTRADVLREHRTGTLVKGRTQYQTSIRSNIALTQESTSGKWSILTLLGSGESFTSQWNTAYDFMDSGPQDHPFVMRQAYLQNDAGKWRTQVGVIPPVKGVVSHTSLDKDGWIRGGRIIAPIAKEGQLEIVTGGLHGIDQPGALQPWAPLNYREVEWTQAWGTQFRTEAGATTLDENAYVRSEGRFVTRSTTFPVEFTVELMLNVSNGSLAYDWSAEGKAEHVKIKLEYSFVDDSYGQLGELSNDFFTLGHLGMLALKGPVGDTKKLDWFVKTYVGENELRANAGLVAKLSMSAADTNR